MGIFNKKKKIVKKVIIEMCSSCLFAVVCLFEHLCRTAILSRTTLEVLNKCIRTITSTLSYSSCILSYNYFYLIYS